MSDQAMVGRLERVQKAALPWLVAIDEDQVVGYAYATKWNKRAAYRRSAEISVYLANNLGGRGWGTRLYRQLFDELRHRSIHTIIAGISLPNPASVAIHEKFGMAKVAHFEQVGNKFGKWVDVGYWQVHLD